MKKRIHEILGDYLFSLYKTIRFNYHRWKEHKRYGHYEFPYRDEMSGKRAYVLANGPSLINDIELFKNDNHFYESPKCVLNYFAETDTFQRLKPDCYFLADAAFFRTNLGDRHKKILRLINDSTTWPMSLYIPFEGLKAVIPFISKKNIDIVPISTLQFEGFEKYRYLYYKQGKAVPSFVNVTLMIEYVLLNLGCKDIWLCGVDHTFFNGMTVNDENIPCIVDKHFYGEEFRPLRRKDGYFTMAGWLMDKYLTFKEHENLRGYADYLGARIVNCTKNSWIDAYVRLAQLEKEKA